MKITMYELLGLVKDGEVPKKIKYNDKIFIYDGFSYIYENKTFNEYNRLEEFISYSSDLNDTVEILEEEKKDNFTGWKMYQGGKEVCSMDYSVDEEKKIPEKIKIEQDTPSSNYYIRNEYGTKCALTKHSKMIIETLNQLIDYLKSKGDE